MGESLDIPADDPTVDPLAEALKRIAALERVVNKTAPVQPGLCVPWCGTAPVSLSGEQEPAPQWLLCNGAAVSQAKWPLLFAAIGAKFNQGGEGAGEFRLPDFTNGRCPVGKGASGTFVTVGVKGGAETRTLTTNELPAHNHPGSSASSTPSLSASHSLTAAAHSHTFDFGTQAVASGTAGTART
jgi:microcystin-dependent protein